MIRSLLALAAMAAPLAALAANELSVLPPGRYGCWTSGDATGPTVSDVAGRSFTIVRGSSYESLEGRGTYLLAGDVLTFTRGPFKDIRLRRTREGLWQELARDGETGRLKCNRTGPKVAPA